MIINNVTGTNSLHTNCEQDNSTSILENIHEFIVDCNKEVSKDMMDTDEIIAFDPNYHSGFDQEYLDIDDMIVFDPEPDVEMIFTESNVVSKREDADDLIMFDPDFQNDTNNYFENESFARASSVICRKLIKITHCEECKNILHDTETSLIENCTKILRGLSQVIPHICSEQSIKKKLLASIESIKVDTLGCPDHFLQVTQKFKEMSADDSILSFCYDINSYLSGKTTVLTLNHNPIQKLAFHQFDQKRKKRKIGKYSDIFNS